MATGTELTKESEMGIMGKMSYLVHRSFKELLQIKNAAKLI